MSNNCSDVNPPRFRAATWNIRLDTPKDGPNQWHHRRRRVAEMICERIRPDLIGLQEVRPNQLADLAEDLAGYGWVGVGRDDGWREGEFCPVFYRRERFRLLQTNTFWLSETPELPGSRSWDAQLTRIATWARLQNLASGGPVCFLNTHLEWTGEEARLRGARLLRARFPAIVGEDPGLLAGDFNCSEGSEPYRALTGAEDGPPVLFDARYRSLEPHQGPTASSGGFYELLGDESRIDFILVTEGVAVLRHLILDDRFGDAFPSDHLPVAADLCFHQPA